MTLLQPPYATGDQLTDWLAGGDYADQVPDDPSRLLVRATDVIRDNTMGQVLIDPDTGLAADPDMADVLARATCAQVEQWFEVGEENDIAGYPAGTNLALGAGAVTALPMVLAPRAARILRLAGFNGEPAPYSVRLV